jgi:DNA-binding NarL/FixJ family response regulator
MEKPVKSAMDLKKNVLALKSVWSRESIITTRGVVYLCELTERLLDAVEKRRKRELRPRKVSEWQRVVSVGMKQGKSMKQISEDYRTAKGAKP